VDARNYAAENRSRFLDELKSLLRIPSVSAVPRHRDDVIQAAGWLRDHLAGLGFQAELIPIENGHPIVYADWMQASGKPTVLFYGHYDVQPVEPLDLWISPPFEPTIRGENLFARGASDDKGQIFAVIKALEAILTSTGTLPLNVKLLIEGEEELGSPGINRWIERRGARKAACDFAWVSDGSLFAPGVPQITTGLRGLIYTEVEVTGASHDLHSGQHGGAAPNPINALATIIAGLKDKKGRVTVPRFYSAVMDPAPEEKASWERLPFREDEYLRELGTATSPGEAGYGILERRWTRPTLDVNGITGGWVGAGPKTVIPAKASAKISMRLVPDQRSKTLFRAFEKRVRALAPDAVGVEVRLLSGSDAVVVDPAAPPIRTAAAVVREIWGAEPVYTREGGSVPIVTQFARVLKVPTVMFGFGLPDDNLHAPNEKYHLPNFYKGIDTVIAWVERVGGSRTG
jgi:acetylornithine deacetylase/succinyl-diaminopimelate desuccinylase-like protein